MDKIARLVVNSRKTILIIFVVLAVACACLIPLVNVNFDDTHYLPDETMTKSGLKRMTEAFGESGNAVCMWQSADIAEILALKARMRAVGGVKDVIWLDDILLLPIRDGLSALREKGDDLSDAEAIALMLSAFKALPARADATAIDVMLALSSNLSMEETERLMALFSASEALAASGFSNLASSPTGPLGEEYASLVREINAQCASFYSGDASLYQLLFDGGDYDKRTTEALAAIDAMPEELYLSGNAAATYYSQRNIMREIIEGTLTVGLVTLAVLFLFSTAWIEPVIYIAVTAVAVAINMGTNALFTGGVSYLTHSIASIMQMVLSIDYAIFLLTRYKKERAAGVEAGEAMVIALKRSLAPILASAMTTIACFITIMFMKFKMGMDMGFVMSKGIVISLLSAFLLMPGVIILFDKALFRSQHASIQFTGTGFSRFVYRARVPIVVIALIAALPAAYLANINRFSFGASASQGEDSPVVINRHLVEEHFGTQEQLAILVPKVNDDDERALTRALTELPGVVSAASYAAAEQSGYAQLLPESMREMFDGKDMRRIVLYLSVPEEGDETIALLNQIDACAQDVYGADAEIYLLGNTAAARDMEASTHTDYSRIAWLSLIAVALIVFMPFRSPLLPILLVLVIEGGIWLNMAIPYLLGERMAFIGYMIIVNVLLGSTIDYAILMTSNYLECRRRMTVEKSVCDALAHSLPALLTSAGIFTLGGAVISIVMSASTVRMFGMAILRGGLCALVMTLVVLPALLAIFDKPILRFRLHKKQKAPDPQAPE